MVSQGWAVAYRKYSTDYVSPEAAAKEARRGVWQTYAVRCRRSMCTPGRSRPRTTVERR